MEDNRYILKIVNDSKTLINKHILLFTFNLFKHIFIKKKNPDESVKSETEKKLDIFIEEINTKIIKNEDKYISKVYTINNFKNIISFVKMQNSLFSGEIIEGILIYTFSFSFKPSQENTFGKYIFNNISKFKDARNYDLKYMFNVEKLVPEELHDIETLLDKDGTADDKINSRITELQENSPFFNLLIDVYYEKYIEIKKVYTSNNKFMNYINNGFSDNQKLSNNIYDKLKDNSSTALDRDISCNSIMSLVSELYFPKDVKFGKVSRATIRLIRSFLIQVFIYSQNSHSPLMEYIRNGPNENYASIPFVYDLKGACIEGRFAYIILSPVRIEPRINKISLAQNNLRECGLYELGKIAIFNKNIKIIEINVSLLRNNYLEFLNKAMGLFENNSVEELNISFNYLKDLSEEYFAKLLIHFKNLKTLNLTMNEFKRGVCSMLVLLKKLYRSNKIKLEVLILNKCVFDESSFYELGELLKCKYCKLKKLYLNLDNIPANVNFLKKLKKNKSLTEIYLNKTEIGNKDTNKIMKVISNSKIQYLYLYKNKISNFNCFLRILYMSKKINDNRDYNKNNECLLTNIDLSNNEIYIKNEEHIELLNKLMNITTLNCIDISHILLGSNPSKNQLDNNKYKNTIEKFKKNLEKNNNNLYKEIKHLRKYEVTFHRFSNLNNEIMLHNLDRQFSEIINNKKAILPVYQKEEARKIMDDEKNVEIRQQFLVDNHLDWEKYKETENKLVNYMKYKFSEKKIKEIKQIKKSKKLILI